MNQYKVPIKNALYMYSYVWDRKRRDELINLSGTDDFNFSDLYAELFLMNARKVIRKGLNREYISKNEAVPAVKGKINYIATITKQSMHNGKVVCEYEEYEENNILNQIIKYTAIQIYRSNGLTDIYKRKLRFIIGQLNGVEYKEIDRNDFKSIRLNRNNDYYFFLLKVCELILESRMLNEKDGTYSFYNIFEDDEKMHAIFELFIYKFYEYELTKHYKVRFQHQLNFNVEGGNLQLLPVMRMDTEILSDTEDIIIDTKYYADYIKPNYGTDKLISANIYQMMAYLNNINTTKDRLRGILLYPMPYNAKEINEKYSLTILSNGQTKPATIEFITIDLSKDWKSIKNSLLSLLSD